MNKQLEAQIEALQNELTVEVYTDDGNAMVCISYGNSSGAEYPISRLSDIGDRVNEYIRNYVL